jgi:hypothetical protein
MLASHMNGITSEKNLRALLPLFVIIGIFLVIGAVLIGSGILPEERAREFRPHRYVDSN